MTTKIAISEVRNVILRAIERNATNVRQMLAIAKYILDVSYLLPAADRWDPEGMGAKPRVMKVMTYLVDVVAKVRRVSYPPAFASGHDLWIAQSPTWGGGLRRSEWRREFLRVEYERLSLLRIQDTALDIGSVESCVALCEDLGAQRERIASVSSRLKAAEQAMRASQHVYEQKLIGILRLMANRAANDD